MNQKPSQQIQLQSFQLTEADANRCKYIGYDIGLGARLQFSLSTGELGKMLLLLGQNKLSVHTNNKKDVLVYNKESRNGLDVM